ncbi:helix-turn-helix transcriptional regulator [Actinomadura viridis]|uniref:Transcriptional regulator with XRE-family HTH domain n=1 Tax=Actinomadura viridis TaxID=58110 RepID=A0A931GTF6_9ACTN|nr:helix-turn-helix transcriptional regulator [Actinomadura viridis]MBG6091954.1 transcriptional regulator with XRE-family HTH domain [Actinomadura viridis]
MNESPDPRSSMWNWIAHHLRFLRREHGWSGDRLAQLLNCARSSISRLENGKATLAPDQAEKIDAEWKTGGIFSIMVYYATYASDPDWYKAHLELEAQASILKLYELSVVPGLLQNEEYARALFLSFGVKDVDGQVAKRMERQKRLTRPGAPMLWVLLAEPVLEWQVGGPDVLYRQLARLLEISHWPNASIRVVPKTAGAHPGLPGAFKIMKVGRSDLVYTEAVGGGRLARGTSEVETFLNRFDHIGAKALPEDATRRLIEKTMEAIRNDPVA